MSDSTIPDEQPNAPVETEIDAGAPDAPDSELTAPREVDLSTESGAIPLVGEEEPAPSGTAAEGDAADGEEEGEEQADGELEAIICVPGIGESDGTRFMDVAERIATAMDNCAESSRAYFTVATRDAKTRNGAKLQSAAIVRHEAPDDAQGREVLHLYEYDYRPRLGNGLEKRPPLVQAAAMAWTLLFGVPSVLLAFARFRKRRGKGWRHKLHVVYGFGMAMAIFLYIVLLGASAVAAGGKMAQSGPPASADSAAVVQHAVDAAAAQGAERARVARKRAEMGWVRATFDEGVEKASDWFLWLAGLTVVIPLAGTFVRFNMRQVLENAAPKLTSATGYIAAGQQRAEIVGELVQVIQHLDENGAPGKRYARVHVAGYSFGSVVAIDALFPHEAPANARLRGIATLVTIGCPYDFVRTYWPRYFAGRHGAGDGERPKWINVYAPLDVLGSNFLDEPSAADAREYERASAADRAEIRKEWEKKYGRGVELMDGAPVRPPLEDNVAFGAGQGQTAKISDWLKFIGFRVHGMYWSRQSPAAITCFEPIVTRLFAGREEKVLG